MKRIKYLRLPVMLLLLCANSLIAAAQTGNLKGKVVDEQKNGLADLIVELNPDKHQIKTNKKGDFELHSLFPGVYYLSIFSDGVEIFTDSILIQEGTSTEKTFVVLPRIQEIEMIQVSGRNSLLQSPDQLMQLNRSAMPVQIITRQMIDQMGSRRLDEVLKEQTGIAVVSNIAGGSRSTGVQMQGFGSEYVMVLIDGQPMVGRNNGNFDLSRISVSNIERIEIVKGASSCLFGSDAMGGAINIITRYGAIEPQAQLGLRYGTYRMIDVIADAETPFAEQRGSIQASANYYKTNGFNTNPFLQSGQSSPPYHNFDAQARIRYQLAKNTFIGTNIRYGVRHSDMSKGWNDEWQAKDSQNEFDLNIGLNLDHTFRSGWRAVSRYYYTYYDVDQLNRWAGSTSSNEELSFKQQVHRFEQQFAKSYRNGWNLTAGVGASLEMMNDLSIRHTEPLATGFAYLQGDKRVLEKLDLRGGVRYDKTNTYGGRLNPSLGFQYYINEKVSLKAGVASGFKAPDYRMRYLVFFNPSSSYMVIGNDVLQETLQQMQNSGEISEIFQVADQLNQNLKPEQSISYNVGSIYKPNNKVQVEASLFYHNLKNQIDAIPVATGTTISQLYSYRNLPRAVNKGIEANVQWQIVTDLNFQLGYQYLIAKDLSVKDSIAAGNWPYNQNLHDPKTGISYPAKVSDYWGIVNRSRHMLNARLFYQYRPWDTHFSLRANYRGKYPFADYNNNQYIDRFDTFVPQHLLLNLFIEKRLLRDRLRLSLTIDNMLDFKNQLMPGQPGRVFIGGITYQFRR